MRTSSVAVRPRMSFAFAVSCTPGSCTTMRSAPCCWMIGSATPSSLTRLRSVVMFCCSAKSCVRRCASGLSVRDDAEFARRRPALRSSRSGMRALDLGHRLVAHRPVAEAHDHRLALARDAAVLDALVAQRAADVVRERFHLLGERRLHVHLQQEMHAAAQVEPEIHRQRADRGEPARVFATAGSARRRSPRPAALCSSVLAPFNCVSVSSKRTLTPVGSRNTPVRGTILFFLRMSSTRASSAASDLSVALHRRDLHRRHFAEEIRAACR